MNEKAWEKNVSMRWYTSDKILSRVGEGMVAVREISGFYISL